MPAQSQLGVVLRTHLPKLLSTCRSAGPVRLQQPLCLSPREASLTAFFSRPQAAGTTAPSSLTNTLSHGRLLLQSTIVPATQTISSALLQPAIVHATHTVTPVLRLMTPHERAVRLPTAVPLNPVSTPSSSTPQALPQHPTAANREVLDPCGELVPHELPQHSSQIGVTIECVHPEIRKNQRSMKKHKLLKLRKKNKVKNEYRILMDVARKEKAFMMEQMAIMREGDGFNAEQYVQGRLDKVNTETVPRLWNGQPQPKSIVMEQMFKAGIKIPGYEK